MSTQPKNRRIRWAILLAFAAVLIGITIGGYYYLMHKQSNPDGIAPSGGEALNIRLDTPSYFSQRDPRWEDQKIGGSGETIRRVGCTLCSLSMAICSLGGESDPATLNQLLIENSGYTERGWLIWGAVEKAAPGMEVAVYSSPDFKLMDQALKDSQVSLVKFWLGPGIPHWVAIVGKEDKEYLALDPLRGDQPIRLSELADAIESLRVVRRK